MSRLIVKNLPGYLDDEKLKSHFAKRSGSVITDVKVLRRPDGTSRRFGFVGFSSENDAEDALRYFDKTYIDTSRISVAFAKALQDEELKATQERRKAAKKGQYEVQQVGTRAKSNAGRDLETNPNPSGSEKGKKKAISFEEFMEVMKPKSKRKAVGNGKENDADALLDPKVFEEEDIRPSKKTRKTKRAADPLSDSDIQHDDPVVEREDAATAALANDEGMTDVEYMYKMMKRKVGTEFEEKDDVKTFEQSDDEVDDNQKKRALSSEEEELDDAEKRRQERRQYALEKKARKDQEDVDTIMTTGRLFVRNLPFGAQEDEIEAFFSHFGEVSQVHLSLDKVSKKSKGIAFVTFANPSHALAAFRSSDGHTFQGRLLHVLPAIQQGPEAEGKTLKDKRRQALKADATKDFKWSTLYMSADAVAASVADRLGIDKTDILNPHDEENGKSISPAVRLALAETSVINETRDFLKEEGINVDAFDETNGQSTKRSDTVLLVKNIPYGTAADTIQSMFEKHGSVERIVMPPGGTIAVVEMQVAGEAKVAFKALSYKRLGNSVLYLEKAPLGLLAEKIESTKKKAEVADTKSSSATEIAPESSTKVETGATLFIKNLSFSTTDERLQLAFSKFADLLFVRIQKRESRKRDGTGSVSLSMGYGFAGFRTLQAAQIAQKAMDKTTLDGHVLSVAFSRRGHDNDETRELAEDPNGAEVAPSSKLIVKNLAFEATKKEVRELFAAYGKLKSVRVPRKGLASAGGAASGVRGFGFVEFVSRSEAMYAYKALRHSHLLGRHLVLEWDVEGGVSSSTSTARTSGVDAGNDPFLTRLRQKAAQNVAASSAAAAGTGAHRRDKLKLNDEDIRQAARDERRSQQNNDDEDDDDEE